MRYFSYYGLFHIGFWHYFFIGSVPWGTHAINLLGTLKNFFFWICGNTTQIVKLLFVICNIGTSWDLVTSHCVVHVLNLK